MSSTDTTVINSRRRVERIAAAPVPSVPVGTVPWSQ